MRPTKEALIRKACADMELLEYQVVDVLTDDTLQQLTTDNPEKVIFSIVKANQVDSKLFLTSHQFTNVVGTDIYIYIGNSQGQAAYQKLLEEMSKVRRLDDKLLTFLRDESNDFLTEIDLKTELPEKVPEKIAATLEQVPTHLIYVLLSESLLNKGFGEMLLEADFEPVGDSHLFIFKNNVNGSQMLSRLNQEAFIHLG